MGEKHASPAESIDSAEKLIARARRQVGSAAEIIVSAAAQLLRSCKK